jgi:hypothetical protein
MKASAPTLENRRAVDVLAPHVSRLSSARSLADNVSGAAAGAVKSGCGVAASDESAARNVTAAMSNAPVPEVPEDETTAADIASHAILS